jgi:H+/Cl- antiporter ClcA
MYHRKLRKVLSVGQISIVLILLLLFIILILLLLLANLTGLHRTCNLLKCRPVLILPLYLTLFLSMVVFHMTVWGSWKIASKRIPEVIFPRGWS